jgi:hypothetical protein
MAEDGKGGSKERINRFVDVKYVLEAGMHKHFRIKLCVGCLTLYAKLVSKSANSEQMQQ